MAVEDTVLEGAIKKLREHTSNIEAILLWKELDLPGWRLLVSHECQVKQ